jgi:hypothetical protein
MGRPKVLTAQISPAGRAIKKSQTREWRGGDVRYCTCARPVMPRFFSAATEVIREAIGACMRRGARMAAFQRLQGAMYSRSEARG